MNSKSATLNDRIGGDQVIAAAVEALNVRVLADPLLRQYFAGLDPILLKKHQREVIAHITGGPGEFTACLAKSHSHLRIEKPHFYAVADHLVAALVDLGVEESLCGEVLSLVEPTLNDVVNTPPRDQQPKPTTSTRS
ncbi:MAG TPA: group 1 truncated hemoglobin [Bryobacteraceae bacterium]|nr:group 1 truncated hemoglobin [Bryobacteraceae bacterium]